MQDTEADSLNQTLKRSSIKDELTGQENKQATPSAKKAIGEGAATDPDNTSAVTAGDASKEEEFELYDGDVESDHDLEVYKV